MESHPESRLKNVFVSKYKNLFNCSLDIANFSVLVGANNSGKSNFIELFEVLDNVFFGGDKGREFAAYLVSSSNEATTVKFEYEVKDTKGKVITAEYGIRFNSEVRGSGPVILIESEYLNYKSISSTGKPRRLFFRENGKLTTRDDSGKFKEQVVNDHAPAFDTIRSLYPDINNWPYDFAAYFMPVLQFVSPAILSVHRIADDYDNKVYPLLFKLYEFQENKTESYTMFHDYFINILDLKDMEIRKLSLGSDQKKTIYYCVITENMKSDLTLIQNMSDGTKILFLILYRLFIDNHNLTCIEEPEIGLHPKALSKLLNLFFNKVITSQAIITTHSSYLINLVNPENVFVLESSDSGYYTMKKVSTIQSLKERLKSKYVNFGDLLVSNFQESIDTDLD